MVAEALESRADRHQARQASIFISYSREDTDFVRHLDKELTLGERTTWVDLEDIRPTEEWLASVYSGIESSNAFVFVISPDSVESKSCLLELNHAVEHNKRLVPVVRREVRTETVSEPLRSPQWIFFRDQDDFEDSFQELVDALDTDLEWLHEHTRLLTRAIEWDSNQRDNSFLLRGRDLKTAEEWQVRAADLEPKLTALQTEYVLTSRRTATRRQRVTLGVVTLGLIVAVVLGIVALLARNEAEQQRKKAVEQRDIALGRQLTAQAQIGEDQGPQFLQQSVLFATEAEKLSPRHSPETERTLRQGLTILPRPVAHFSYEDEPPQVSEMSYGGTSKVGSVVFSPDGKYLAATNGGNTARVWDPTNDREIATVIHKMGISDVAFSPDGKYLATGSEDNTTKIWDASSGKEIGRLDLGDDVAQVLFSPNGTYLAIRSYGNAMRLWNLDSGKEVPLVDQGELDILDMAFSLDGESLAIADPGAIRLWDPVNGKEVGHLDYKENSSPTSIAFSPDGKYLAAGSRLEAGTGASVWNLASSEEVMRVSSQAPVEDLDFSPDGKYLATASTNRTASVWDVATSKELVRVDHADLVTSVTFSPDGRYLATASYDNTARIWDLATGGEEISRMIHEEPVNEAVFSPDGKYLATASQDNTVRVWDPYSTDEFVDLFHPDVRTFAISPDGEYLATASGDGLIEVWDPQSGKEVSRMMHGANVLAAAFSPNGKYLATGGVDSTVRLWDVTSGEEVAHASFPDLSIEDVVFSSDGKYFAAAGTTTVRVWATTDEEVIGKKVVELRPPWVNDLEFSHDGDYLAIAGSDGAVTGIARVWDVAKDEEVARVIHERPAQGTSVIQDVAFSPDGQYLATASDDWTARVWDLSSGNELGHVSHQGSVLDVAFGPDGRYLATASQDGTARVWDVSTSTEVARMSHELNVSNVAFTPDGKYLATASQDNTAHVWNVSSGTELMRMTHGPIDDYMREVAFSPDGTYVVTVGSSLSRVWRWRTQKELVEAACTRLTSNFTRAQWQRNLPTIPYHETCPKLAAS